jgi:hypothetical protein
MSARFKIVTIITSRSCRCNSIRARWHVGILEYGRVGSSNGSIPYSIVPCLLYLTGLNSRELAA